MARGFGAFCLVLLGSIVGMILDSLIEWNPTGLLTIIITVSVAVWVIVYWQKKTKEELEAELSLLKDKLEKSEQKP